jgi:2-polyprenyl-6-methoxyphenol hydroxylase-like FAD-dependent oxidoreductase
MTTPQRPRALIAGGSLSGLFAATTLRAFDWEVAVFERSADALDSRGGGIVLQPDALAALRFAGVGHTDALGVRLALLARLQDLIVTRRTLDFLSHAPVRSLRIESLGKP